MLTCWCGLGQILVLVLHVSGLSSQKLHVHVFHVFHVHVFSQVVVILDAQIHVACNKLWNLSSFLLCGLLYYICYYIHVADLVKHVLVPFKAAWA